MGRGRPVKNDDFVPFRTWLTDCGYTGSTATVYTSLVRKIVGELRQQIGDQQAVDSFFRAAWADPSYQNYRTAYRMFCRWASDEKGVALPTLPDARIGTKSVFRADVQPLSSAVRAAVRQLRDVSRIKLRRITQLAWQDVDQRELTDRAAHVHIVDRGQVGTVWPVRLGTILPLYEFAQPGGRLATPLVPLSPSAGQPYPYDLLLREVAEFTEEEVAALRSGTVLPMDAPITMEETRDVNQARRRALGLPVPGEESKPEDSTKVYALLGIAPPGSALGGSPPGGLLVVPQGAEGDKDSNSGETAEAQRLKDLMKFDPKEDEVAAQKGLWHWEDPEN